MIDVYPIDFAAPVTILVFEPFTYTVIDLPAEAARHLPPPPVGKRLRLTGEIAGRR